MSKVIVFLIKFIINGLLAFVIAAVLWAVLALLTGCALTFVSIILPGALMRVVEGFVYFFVNFTMIYTLTFIGLMIDDYGNQRARAWARKYVSWV